MKAIIYCRKSTDRSDRQQLSIGAQEQEARKIAEREWLEVVHVFKETKSAKEPGRPLFNEMMSLFSTGKADCIITWKLNRIARNPVDEWTIKWSIQNGIIKAIYTEWEVFKTGDNVLIMWMHFWMSTQYILDLQKDIKRWMQKKVESGGVCQKAPIGYINNRLDKTIEVDPIKSEWVKMIFNLRIQKMAISTISKKLFDNWYKRPNGKPYPITSIENIIKNKFYIWLIKFNWVYYPWKYKTFISKSLFERANNIYQWVYEYRSYGIDYYLKWLVKDSDWRLLNTYKQKGHTYYKSSSKSPVTVNISEKKLFNTIWEELEDYQMNNDFKDLNIKLALKILDKIKPDLALKRNQIEKEINKLEEKRQTLLDLRLEWEIDKTVYSEKLNQIVLKISELESEKSNLQSRKDEKKILESVELGCSLYQSYKAGSLKHISNCLKKTGVELFLNTKKELSIEESPFLKLIKFCNFQNGGANEVRTRVDGVADRCITTLPWHH